MSDPLELIPDRKVRDELGVTDMTLWRWDRNAELIALGWPAPVYINKRKFPNRQQLEKFKTTMMERAINDRDRKKRIV